MTGFIKRLPHRFRRRCRDESGSSTVEFALMLPVLTLLMASAVELGIIMTRHVMLERAVDLAVRDIRLGATPSATELVNNICDRAVVIPECATSLVLDMSPIDEVTWDLPAQGTPCYNRQDDIEPATEFTHGVDNEIMLIRACVIVDPIMPWYGMGKAIDDLSGGDFYLTAASAFVNEPK